MNYLDRLHPTAGTIHDLSKRLDLALPDSSIVREACEHVQAIYEPWLYLHVLRSWFFAALLARSRALRPDGEILAVSALFHDLGLATQPDIQIRFEVVGAVAARDFAKTHGMDERNQEQIWDAVALHTTPSIARHKAPEVACCQAGIGLDFTGTAYDQLPPNEIEQVVATFPRLGMKRQMKDCLCRVAREAPRTTYDNAVSDFGRRFVEGYPAFSVADALASAPFPD